MNENKKQETFLAKVHKGHRVTIYETVRDFLGIEEGDILRLTIQIERKGSKSTELSLSDLKVPDIEGSLPVVEPEPEEDLEEETPELTEEKPTEEEPPEETEELLPDIVEPEPEPEEVSEKGESWGQEHVEPCPEGLDWPLQDLTICREKGCDHYRRKYGENPQRCTWPEWKPIGWEDEIEEPEEHTAEETVEEDKETAEEPIAGPEEPIETEDDGVLLIYCESGVHKPGLIPHEKRDLGDGWAMYTCLSCKKKTPMLIRKAEEILEAEN